MHACSILRNARKHPRLRWSRWTSGYPSTECVAYRSRICARAYHSERGVYGYRPRISTQFQVPKEYLETRSKNSNFYRLVTAYREFGHKQANVNPVSAKKPTPLAELNLERFGLRLTDKVSFEGILTVNKKEGTVEEALAFLDKTYSDTIGLEFSHLETEEEREWFAEAAERCTVEPLEDRTRVAIAKQMLQSQAFDNFLAVKFVSLKRYGGEGAEAMMAFFHEFFKLCANGNR